MGLPSIGDQTADHVIEFGDVTVTFQLRLIPGGVFQAIIDHHRAEDGSAPVEAVGPMMLTHGIRAIYSSEEPKPQDWARPTRGPEETPAGYVERVPVHADALEVWRDWPEWARASVYSAVVAYSTRGPTADPSEGSPKPRNAAR